MDSISRSSVKVAILEPSMVMKPWKVQIQLPTDGANVKMRRDRRAVYLFFIYFFGESEFLYLKY